ncbi:MAG: LicD family protein [Ruminococcaceae bacterium]|nr:LicD family protein [Oscillospiraceae bacterium]
MDNHILTGDELKKALFGITLDVVKYCDAHGLSYIMVGGTLLGAVRHKGFIPWDDDIDLAMPREDYNRLHELVKTEPIGENYKLVSLTAENSPYPFAKVLDMNTKIVNSKTSLHTELWVDIFPIDGLPQLEEKTLSSKAERIKRYAFLLENACCEYGSGKTLLRKIVKIPVIAFSRIKGAEYYGKKMQKIAMQYPLESSRYAASSSWGGIKAAIEKEKMLTTCELEFEGAMLKAPVGYEEYLTKMYGDYMTLPPENQRINHLIEVIKIKEK